MRKIHRRGRDQPRQDRQTAASHRTPSTPAEKAGENPPEMGGGFSGKMAGNSARKSTGKWVGHARATAALAKPPRQGGLRVRYQVYTKAIYGPPYSSPKAMQEPDDIHAKPTDSTTSTAGRQPAQTAQHHQTAHATAAQPAPAHTTGRPARRRPARRRRRPVRR